MKNKEFDILQNTYAFYKNPKFQKKVTNTLENPSKSFKLNNKIQGKINKTSTEGFFHCRTL